MSEHEPHPRPAHREPPADAAGGGWLQEMATDECLQLLRHERLGRVAVMTPGGRPLIRPVNYVFDDRTRSIVFRSQRGSKLFALTHSDRACFEIDSGSDATRSWSVIVTGVVETVTQPGEVARLERLGLDTPVPPAAGSWMRIHVNVLSGRVLA